MPTTKHTQLLDVSGMHCASCASIIKRKLQKLDGVAQVDPVFISHSHCKASLDAKRNVEMVDAHGARFSPLTLLPGMTRLRVPDLRG